MTDCVESKMQMTSPAAKDGEHRSECMGYTFRERVWKESWEKRCVNKLKEGLKETQQVTPVLMEEEARV